MMLRACAAALLLAFASGPAAAAPEPELVFRGNELFDELVYRSVLSLGAGEHPAPTTARKVGTTLRSFLRRAGYDLATVHITEEPGRLLIDIDEGRLDKIILVGDGILETIRFRLELALPSAVFNRRSLERQLKQLSEKYSGTNYTYQLVPAEVQEQWGPQPDLDEMEPLFGLPGVRAGLRYQLQIHVVAGPWSSGFAPDVTIGFPEGLGGGGHYQGLGLFFDSDRWELRARAAGGSRQQLDSASSSLIFTRALAAARWLSPPLGSDAVRPAVTLGADWLSLQRGDLQLQGYQQATFTVSAGAVLSRTHWTAAAGLGLERRFLFNLERTPTTDPLVDRLPRAQTRPYAEASAEWVFNPEDLRTDRKHLLHLEARLYSGSPSSDEMLSLRGLWQRRFPFGWHEVWCEARATFLQGQVLFPDEESLGNHLRGAYGDPTLAAASVGAELRYSLLRDIFKVGVFYTQAVYGASIDRAAGTWAARVAGAGGPAIHLLFSGEFQLDLYAAAGWKQGGGFGFAPALVLRQVY